MGKKPMDGAEAARIMYGQSGDSGMSNLVLWDKVQETNPKHTKAFSKGGGFKGTSINPTYNNRKATEMFGLCGIGWGVDIVNECYQEGAPILINGKEVCKEITHVLQISFWYKWESEIGKIPSFGQTSYVGSNKNGVYTDEEAPKKSLTDAITKAMSMLGFSADVFLGMYDDVKYINDIKERDSKTSNAPKILTPQQKLDAANKKAQVIIAEYKNCKDLGALADIQQKYHSELKRFSEGYNDIFSQINTVGLQVIASFDQ